MKNFAITCGGTGGHISPGIAVAEQLLREGHQCTLVLSDKNIDRLMLKKYPNMDFITTRARPFSKKLIKFLQFVFSQIRSFFFAAHFLRNKKIDCIIGFGGFTNAPFVLAGFFLRKRVFLHESNRVVGKSIRILSYFAEKVYLPSGVKFRSKYLNKKVEHIGYPLREEFKIFDKVAARESIGIDPLKRLILVIGGSQGAKILTDWAQKNYEILNHHGILVYCITGGFDKKIHGNVFKKFSDNMNVLYNACDLVVSRAGAGTLAEATFFNKPMILVPYPYAAGDHQTKNAQYVVKMGQGYLIPENQINLLTKSVIQVLNTSEHDVSHVFMIKENPVTKIIKDVTK